MTNQPTPEQMQEIEDALASGRKIEAIKLYREASGKGLKEAKEFIDELMPTLKKQHPKKYANVSTSKGSGCASVFFICFSFL